MYYCLFSSSKYFSVLLPFVFFTVILCVVSKRILENQCKQVAPLPDPNGPLWDMLKNIALTPDDRLAVGMHLCKPEFQVQRSFLINMGQEYLERWVFNHLSGGDLGGN